jgi:TetR/AcrR family transcriptional regulator, transcriptional repressor for nem operon
VTKAERTRIFIIEKTAPLFNKKGFDGTSLQDLTDATGLTKGALYGNFRDKEEISLEAFRYSMQKVRSMVDDKMKGGLTFRQQLEALLEFYSQYVFDPPVPGGCPLLNSAIETDDHRVSMRRVVLKELTATLDFIARLFERGVKAGEFNKNIDPRQLAYIFFCSVEGGLMFARLERSREAMDIVVQHCRRILNDIVNHGYATKKSRSNRSRRAYTPGKHSS